MVQRTSGVPLRSRSSETVTRAPASALPAMTGVESFVTRALVIVGCFGASVSSVTVPVARRLWLPAASVAIAVTDVVTPSAMPGNDPTVGVAVAVSIVQVPSAATRVV